VQKFTGNYLSPPATNGETESTLLAFPNDYVEVHNMHELDEIINSIYDLLSKYYQKRNYLSRSSILNIAIDSFSGYREEKLSSIPINYINYTKTYHMILGRLPCESFST